MNMFYGTVINNKGKFKEIKDNSVGVITAYLPKDKVFAIFFNKENWFTFSGINEEQFKDMFTVKLEKK